MAEEKVLRCDVPECAARGSGVSRLHSPFPDVPGHFDICKKHERETSLADLRKMIQPDGRRQGGINPLPKGAKAR